MKIEPMPNVVYIKTEKAKVGAFDTSMRDSAVEYAEVIEIPNISTGMVLREFMGLKVGDKVFVKGWAIDLIDFNGERYEFVNIKTEGIIAKVNDD